MSVSPPPEHGRTLGHIAEWEILAVDYVAGTLTPDDRDAVDAHLDSCPACAAALARQQAVASLMGATAMVAPPADVEARVLAAFTEEHVPTAAGHTLAPTSATPARRSEAAGWWERMTSFLDRPGMRRLGPALAATLILAMGLAGLTQLTPGGVGDQAADKAAPTTAARSQTAAAPDSTSVVAGGADTDGADRRDTETPLTRPDETAVASAPDDTTATSEGGAMPPIEDQEGPNPVLTGTTGAAGSEAAVMVAPDVGAPVVYLTITAGETTASAEDLVHWSTGLSPLPSELWLGAPTYAAFMSTGVVDTMTRDLAAQGVRVEVSSGPPAGMGALAESFAAEVLPMLGAGRSGPEDETSDGTGGQADEAVLLVVLIAR